MAVRAQFENSNEYVRLPRQRYKLELTISLQGWRFFYSYEFLRPGRHRRVGEFLQHLRGGTAGRDTHLPCHDSRHEDSGAIDSRVHSHILHIHTFPTLKTKHKNIAFAKEFLLSVLFFSLQKPKRSPRPDFHDRPRAPAPTKLDTGRRQGTADRRATVGAWECHMLQ